MKIPITVYQWHDTFAHNMFSAGGVTGMFEDAKTQAEAYWKARASSDPDAELHWRPSVAPADGGTSLLYYTADYDTKHTGVTIAARAVEVNRAALKAPDVMPWVWFWEDSAGHLSDRPYANLRFARHDAEEHYRMRNRRYAARFRWVPAKGGDPTDDPDDKFLLQMEADGFRIDYFLRRKSIVHYISDAYEVPEEIKDMFDQLAGKVHSENGEIMTGLRRLLQQHARIVLAGAGKEAEE